MAIAAVLRVHLRHRGLCLEPLLRRRRFEARRGSPPAGGELLGEIPPPPGFCVHDEIAAPVALEPLLQDALVLERRGVIHLAERRAAASD
eukprot:9503781-Pyramimonas_sp.AAC.2